MHRANAESLGLRMADFSYQALCVTTKQDLEAVVARLRAGDLSGINVTTPHKQSIVPLLDECTAGAAQTNAVNTVYRKENGQLIGDNTDLPAIRGELESLLSARGFGKNSVETPIEHAVILGAGGAARAAALALSELGIRHVSIVNRTNARTESLIADLSRNVRETVFRPATVENGTLIGAPPTTASLFVQCTSAPLADNNCWVDFFQAALKHPKAHSWHAYDMVIGRAALPFLRHAKDSGCANCSDGRGMLVEQGALAFERWTGRAANRTAMRDALESALR
jgi:shikimate dehydrogenase